MMKMPEDWNDLRCWTDEEIVQFAKRHAKGDEATARLCCDLQDAQSLLIGYVCGALSRDRKP